MGGRSAATKKRHYRKKRRLPKERQPSEESVLPEEKTAKREKATTDENREKGVLSGTRRNNSSAQWFAMLGEEVRLCRKGDLRGIFEQDRSSL